MYLWLKAFHIIAVISWMAGMLYLPRLFVYHCAAAPGSPQSETFKVMERRLLRLIINPAMIATWILGIWVAQFSERRQREPAIQSYNPPADGADRAALAAIEPSRHQRLLDLSQRGLQPNR